MSSSDRVCEKRNDTTKGKRVLCENTDGQIDGGKILWPSLNEAGS